MAEAHGPCASSSLHIWAAASRMPSATGGCWSPLMLKDMEAASSSNAGGWLLGCRQVAPEGRHTLEWLLGWHQLRP